MSTAEKDQMTHLCRHLDVHVSTLLMITLTVLTTRQLSFAALALLVDAATFTRTLKQNRKYVASVTFPCNHKVFSGLTPRVLIPALTPNAFVFFEALRHFSGFSGRHSSSSWSRSSSLGDISSSMLMVALSAALAVVKRFALGFSEKEIQQTQNKWNDVSIHNPWSPAARPVSN